MRALFPPTHTHYTYIHVHMYVCMRVCMRVFGVVDAADKKEKERALCV